MCVRPVFKALGTVPTVITHRKKAIEREKALARGPKAGLAADPLCWEDRETQSWLGHLTGRGCARQRSRKQEARTLSQDLNVFRKWPRREEGECLSESSKQKPGHWPGSRRRHGLDNSEPILESLRASMWPPPWVWRSSDREPASVRCQRVQHSAQAWLGGQDRGQRASEKWLGKNWPKDPCLRRKKKEKKKSKILPRSHGKPTVPAYLWDGCDPREGTITDFLRVLSSCLRSKGVKKVCS